MHFHQRHLKLKWKEVNGESALLYEGLIGLQEMATNLSEFLYKETFVKESEVSYKLPSKKYD